MTTRSRGPSSRRRGDELVRLYVVNKTEFAELGWMGLFEVLE